MMTNEELIAELSDLLQADIDAVKAYEQAIDNISEISIAKQLSAFKADHQRHIHDYNTCLQKMGATVPKQDPDFKGYLIQGFTAIRSLTGTVGALKAMISNEEFINKRYDAASKHHFPADIEALVEKNYADEQRHLKTIQELLLNFQE